MKKAFLLFGATVLFSIGIIGFTSCDEETLKALDCIQSTNEWSAAVTAYSENETPTTAECNEYKTAIQSYIDNCEELTETEIAQFQAQITELDCESLTN